VTPPSWPIDFRNGEESLAYWNLFLFHVLRVDFGPERELQLIEQVVVLSLRARCRHVELVICDRDGLVEESCAATHVVSVRKLDFNENRVQVLVPQERRCHSHRHFFLLCESITDVFVLGAHLVDGSVTRVKQIIRTKIGLAVLDCKCRTLEMISFYQILDAVERNSFDSSLFLDCFQLLENEVVVSVVSHSSATVERVLTRLSQAAQTKNSYACKHLQDSTCHLTRSTTN